MNAVFFDSKLSDEARRRALYEGQLFVYSPTEGSLELCRLAQQMARDAFHPFDPHWAQFSLPVERYVAILADLKPRFIHHPLCKELLPKIMGQLGCDLDKTYFDVPRLRTATHGGYLTAGIAYAYHPHRDCWYSAPLCQINWWMPLHDIGPESAIAFHLRYWDRAVQNDSAGFTYRDWIREGRRTAAQHITADTRKHPRPAEPVELEPQVRLLCPPGGIIMFSGAHLHSTVANTSGRTRLSIDFRTVHFDDAMNDTGAPNVDSACTGTSIGDFVRCMDLAPLPPALVDRYEAGNVVHLQPPTGGSRPTKTVSSMPGDATVYAVGLPEVNRQ